MGYWFEYLSAESNWKSNRGLCSGWIGCRETGTVEANGVLFFLSQVKAESHECPRASSGYLHFLCELQTLDEQIPGGLPELTR